MAQPHGFSWVDKPLLGACARPDSADELHWLRQQNLQLLVSLTENPPRRDWINEAGLFLLHLPVEDMHPPTQEQLDQAISTITKAHGNNLGVTVHCGAGLGRTGVVLACYFVTKGLNSKNAIARVRRMRPGSIETDEQAEAVDEFAKRQPAVD